LPLDRRDVHDDAGTRDELHHRDVRQQHRCLHVGVDDDGVSKVAEEGVDATRDVAAQRDETSPEDLGVAGSA
jgi:hypothetical protein